MNHIFYVGAVGYERGSPPKSFGNACWELLKLNIKKESEQKSAFNCYENKYYIKWQLKTQCCRKTSLLTGQFLLYFRHASVGANCPLSPNNLKRD